MATNTVPEPQEHPPLARDSQGNLVAVPDGTVALRICIKTPGRPKEILGPDKQPMRFRLNTTVEEIARTYGADTYRVYALDDLGKVLDFVTELDLSDDRRDRRNAALETPHGARTSAFAASTDLRYALDAIVQMMRANGEALRSVTVAQADWVKSIASSRGFFRSGPPPIPPSRREDNYEDEEHDDEDDELEPEPKKKTIYDVLAPLAEQIAPAVGPLVTMLTSGAMTAPAPSGSSAAAGVDAPPTDLALRPRFEMRDLIDFRYAGDKGKAKRAAQASSDQPNAPTAKRSLQERVMSDPKLVPHFMAISALLSNDERAALMGLANQLGDLEQERLLAEIRTLPATDAASLLRALLVELSPSTSETSPKNQ